jgi:hypothetical protein
MKRPTSALVLVFGALVALADGCSGRSIVIGGDPLGSGGNGGSDTGGVVGGGVASAAATGGVFGLGGSSAPGGSSIPVGGTAPASGGSTAEGGADGVVDPYPRVAYEDGQGYRRSCPQSESAWGFTCWNFDNQPHACQPSGDPYCNACSCAVPCETSADCPAGITGQPAECIGSATTVKSCFLVCTEGDPPCPLGMTCSLYPGVYTDVCVWLSEKPFGQPPI